MITRAAMPMGQFTRLFTKSGYFYGAPTRQKMKWPRRSIQTCTPKKGSEQLPWLLPPPEYDWLFLCNPAFTDELEKNILSRKGVGDIRKVLSLYGKQENCTDAVEMEKVQRELHLAASDLPNISHPSTPIEDEVVVEKYGEKQNFKFKPHSAVQLGEHLGILRVKDLAYTTGQRTYFFTRALAKLEQALVQYTLDKLLRKGFTMVSVPDLIHPQIIEACGFKVSGERTQVYQLESQHGDLCLAGTAEMSLAGLFMNKVVLNTELPKRLATVSRCFRAETSNVLEETGIYRVHQFTKVEMFGVTADETGEESENLFSEFVSVQKDLFSDLGLHYRIVNMPRHELGAPAYKKYDIETWMPTRGFYGEISSTSNCTDYQARRLHIKYVDDRCAIRHCHTVNGTGCAVPRMVMAILENFQNKDGSISIPEALQEYMGSDVIRRDSEPPVMLWIKSKKS